MELKPENRDGIERAEQLGRQLAVAITHRNQAEIARLSRVAAMEAAGTGLNHQTTIVDAVWKYQPRSAQVIGSMLEEYTGAVALGDLLVTPVSKILATPQLSVRSLECIVRGIVSGLPVRDPLEG